MIPGFSVEYNDRVGNGSYAYVYAATPLCELGCGGGHGHVVKVTDVDIQPPWPDDIPMPTCFFNRNTELYFEREVEILGALQTLECVPRICGWWAAGEDRFLAMERLNQEPTKPILMCQIRQARQDLRQIHAKGVAHCDITRGNVLFRPQTNNFVFIDFQCSLSLAKGDDPVLVKLAQIQDITNLEAVLRMYMPRSCPERPSRKRLRDAPF
jgi:hypothetical protein